MVPIANPDLAGSWWSLKKPLPPDQVAWGPGSGTGGLGLCRRWTRMRQDVLGTVTERVNTRENAGLDLSSGLRERRGVVGGLKDMKAIELRG